MNLIKSKKYNFNYNLVIINYQDIFVNGKKFSNNLWENNNLIKWFVNKFNLVRQEIKARLNM